MIDTPHNEPCEWHNEVSGIKLYWQSVGYDVRSDGVYRNNRYIMSLEDAHKQWLIARSKKELPF